MLENLNITKEELEPYLEWKTHDLVPGLTFKAAKSAPLLKSLLYSRGFRNWVPFFVWPGSIATSSFILKNPELVKDKFVYDLACGGGLIGITCKKAGALDVTCIDSSEVTEYFVDSNSKKNNETVQFLRDSVLNILDMDFPKNSIFFCSEIDFPHENSKDILVILNKLAQSGYPVYTTHTMRDNPQFNFNDFTAGITRFKLIDKQLVVPPSPGMEAKPALKTLLVKIIPL